MQLPRSSYQYRRKVKDDSDIENALSTMVEKHPAIGFWQSFHRFKNRGETWNHKPVYRVYCKMNLNIRRRAKKRLPERVKQKLSVPDAPNQMWSIDFMSDALSDGRKVRLLNVLEDFNRDPIAIGSLAIEVDTSLPALRVIRVLENLVAERGKPSNIRTDNGPEFISHKLIEWCNEKQITLQFIQPGRPMQNAYIERKNGSIRRELLNAYVFQSLHEVRLMSEEWRKDYNEERPHKSLNHLSPLNYLKQWNQKKQHANDVALSTPASETLNQIEAQPVVDKADKPINNPLLLN